MGLQDPLIISDTISPPDRRPDWTPRVAALAALALGVYAAWFYARAGLTLSHYDAKAHLVVARRVIDAHGGALWSPSDGTKAAAVLVLPR